MSEPNLDAPVTDYLNLEVIQFRSYRIYENWRNRTNGQIKIIRVDRRAGWTGWWGPVTLYTVTYQAPPTA